MARRVSRRAAMNLQGARSRGVAVTVPLSSPGRIAGSAAEVAGRDGATGMPARLAAVRRVRGAGRRRGAGRAGGVIDPVRRRRARRAARGARSRRFTRTRAGLVPELLARRRIRFTATRRATVERRRRRRRCFRREATGAARALRAAPEARAPPAALEVTGLFDPAFCARRALFQALRAAAASLRARLASRLASFRRLRARLSSSLAIRTRCLATSACSRTRPRGSAVEFCSLPVFFICGPRSERTRVSHKAQRVSSPGSYPQNLCITMWT
jgi:hypothetical protein